MLRLSYNEKIVLAVAISYGRLATVAQAPYFFAWKSYGFQTFSSSSFDFKPEFSIDKAFCICHVQCTASDVSLQSKLPLFIRFSLFFRFSDEREDVQKKTFGKWINSQLIKVRGVLYISSWIMTLKNKKSIHLLDQFFIGDGLVLRSPRWNAITSLTECVDWSNLCEYTTHFC